MSCIGDKIGGSIDHSGIVSLRHAVQNWMFVLESLVAISDVEIGSSHDKFSGLKVRSVWCFEIFVRKFL